MDKKEAEELKNKLFNKKENGWNSKTAEQKQEIFDYAKGYIDYMNKSKTEREIISTSTEIAHQNGFKDIKDCETLKAGDKCTLPQASASGYVFQYWEYNGTHYSANTIFTMPAANVHMKGYWAQESGRDGGGGC